MPQRENYRATHPNETPQPHCKPGYTGYLPGFGPKRLYQMSDTYARMTHNLMTNHPIAGLRLATIKDNSNYNQKQITDDIFVWRHEKTANDVKYRRDIISGYAGYVPRKMELFGKVFDVESKEAIARFENMRVKKEEADERLKYDCGSC